MTETLRPEDLKPGDVLIMTMGNRQMEVKVGKIDMERQQFMTSFGPVPFSSLSLLRRKT